jgi:transcriptional regulator with XRE-family HTH domain
VAQLADERNVAGRLLVAKNVRRLRLEKGLSQQEIAERAGIHRTHLVRFENYEVNLSLDVFFAIADALGVEPRELLLPQTEWQR